MGVWSVVEDGRDMIQHHYEKRVASYTQVRV